MSLNATISTSKDSQYFVKSCDSIGGQTNHFRLSEKRPETRGLHHVFKNAIGARVMLTANVNVSDGLVNGARGQVEHVITNDNNEVTLILIFDVGRSAIQTSAHRSLYPNAVPLKKHEATFLAKRNLK